MNLEPLKAFFLSDNFILSVVIIASTFVIFLLLDATQKKLSSFTLNIMPEGTDEDKTTAASNMLFKVLKYIILFIALLAIFQVNGINITSIVTSLGLFSAIIAYLLQDLVKDIVMGMRIISDHSYQVGDYVNYGDFIGKVTQFSLRSTAIESIENQNVLYVANRNVTEIQRFNGMIIISVPLPYELDPATADEVLTSACNKVSKDALVESCSYKGLSSFGDSSLNYTILAYPKDIADYLTVKRLIHRTVLDELNTAEISIPYNQIDVHSKN